MKKAQRLTGVRLKLSEHKVVVGLTWQELADGTGIPRDHLIAMDRGYAQQLDIRYIPGLAQFFGVDCGDLVDGAVDLPLESRRPKQRKTEQS